MPLALFSRFPATLLNLLKQNFHKKAPESCLLWSSQKISQIKRIWRKLATPLITSVFPYLYPVVTYLEVEFPYHSRQRCSAAKKDYCNVRVSIRKCIWLGFGMDMICDLVFDADSENYICIALTNNAIFSTSITIHTHYQPCKAELNLKFPVTLTPHASQIKL